MKKTILCAILALLGMAQAVAQEYEYVPFVREGVKWVYYITNADDPYPSDPRYSEGITFYNLELKGDTIINGKTYKAMHKYYGDAINRENDTIPVYLREENKVVYAIVPDGKKYIDCPLGNRFFSRVDPYSGEEYILYDFSNPDAFWDGILNIEEEDLGLYGDSYDYVGQDVIPLDSCYVQMFTGKLFDAIEFHTVVGVGLDSPLRGTPLNFFNLGYIPGMVTFYFSHVVKDGQIIYKGMCYHEGAFDGIDEAVADRTAWPADPRYYDLMGRAVGTDVPTIPGIYIHQGKKIVVR